MDLCQQAWSIASRYHWPEFPGLERSLLEKGECPEGFGHAVGLSVALFARSWPFGNSEEDKAHAKELAKLRLLVAKINVRNRMGG